MKETRMKIVVDKMPEKIEDCPRHYIEQNAVGDKWDACSMGFICCDGVEKCPFYIIGHWDPPSHISSEYSSRRMQFP